MLVPGFSFAVSLRDRAIERARKAVRSLPDELYIRLMFFLIMRRVLHLRKPRTYSEKIQWLKIYGPLESYARYVDKYEVRRYVADKIGSDYLVPLIGVWEDFDQIPLDALPERFVLKATHGSGYNFVCRHKSSLDASRLRETVTTWLSTNFYETHRERQYRHVHPRLIAEAYLEDDSGGLRDYKLTCINGVPQMLSVITRLRGVTTENVYDRDWNLLPVMSKGCPNTREPIPRPVLLDDMYTIAATLAAGFEFVRVDLYFADGRIYFGELTFTPANGFIAFEPRSFDVALADMMDVPAISANSVRT